MAAARSLAGAPRARACGRPQRRRTATVAAAAAGPAVTQRAKFNDGSDTTFAPILNGCWQLAGGHGRVVPDTWFDVATQHATAGLTTFDTADIYGPSEGLLGALRARLAETPGAPKVELFTKYVPNIFQSRPTPASVEASVRRSCAALGVASLDLVQMHWWDYGVPGMVDAGLALAELRARGLIKSVGVTNMDVAACEALLDAGVPLVCNQVQFSMLDRRPLNGMGALCAARGMKLFTYGTLAGGLLSDRHTGAPREGGGLLGALSGGGPRYPPVDLNTSSLKMYWRSVEAAGGQARWRALLAALAAVAARRGVSAAAVALRWAMDAVPGGVVHPIVGVRNASHIAENAAAVALALTDEDRAQLAEAVAALAPPQGDIYSFERA